MKKRFLCLLLCLLMVVPTVLMSCSSGGNEDTPTIEVTGTITLSIYCMTDEKTKPEAIKEVEDAINKITKSKFKTQVKLFYFTEEEYYAKLEETFQKNAEEIANSEAASSALKKRIRDEKKKGNTNLEEIYSAFYAEHPEWEKYRVTEVVTEEGETTEEETVINEEYGTVELKYPDLEENQIDIFYLGGYDRYLTYIDNDWLSALDGSISSDCKIIKDYIYPSYITAAKTDMGTYAIPNNNVIGEYTYLLINKELFDGYSYDIKEINSLADCSEFLDTVANYETDVAPIYGEIYDTLTLTHYWSIDPETLKVNPRQFNIIGAFYDDTATLGTNLNFKSLFTEGVYRDKLLALKDYEFKGYYHPELEEGQKYATRVIRGNADLAKEYGDDYYMVVLESPRGGEEMFDNMFGVSSFTKDVTRSMEIITYLNTNPDMRNLFQYGIAGTDYELDENGALHRLPNCDYYMDLEKTGNIFIAYPEEGMDLDTWEYGIKQNLDSKILPILGFNMTEDDEIDTACIAHINELSELIMERMEACTTYDEFKALVTTLTTELSRLNYSSEYWHDIIKMSADVYDTSDNGEQESASAIYYNWLKAKKYLTAENVAK